MDGGYIFCGFDVTKLNILGVTTLAEINILYRICEEIDGVYNYIFSPEEKDREKFYLNEEESEYYCWVDYKKDVIDKMYEKKSMIYVKKVIKKLCDVRILKKITISHPNNGRRTYFSYDRMYKFVTKISPDYGNNRFIKDNCCQNVYLNMEEYNKVLDKLSSMGYDIEDKYKNVRYMNCISRCLEKENNELIKKESRIIWNIFPFIMEGLENKKIKILKYKK